MYLSHGRFAFTSARSGLLSLRSKFIPRVNHIANMSQLLPPPKCLETPIDVPRKLLLGPGPSNAPPRILAAGALPILGHLHTEFTAIMDEIKEGLKYAFQTQNELTLAISGTGHAGMEASCLNMLERGDVVLVLENGLWGQRFGEMADRMGADVRKLQKPLGEIFTLKEIGEALALHRPCVVFVANSESSSTVLQPLDGLGDLCHSYDCLLIVDTVASMGGVPLCMDKLNIDVMYSGAQKVLGVPPGTAPISFSPRAREKMAKRKTKCASFYFDMEWLANYWGCDEGPRKYHHTAPITAMYQLREGLAMLADEGLEASWERHRKCAELLYEELEKMGLKCFVENKNWRLPTLTGVMVPEGVDWKNVAGYVMKKYKIEISGGLGPTAGKIWRIGVMGYNAQPENVKLVIRALKEAINWDKSSSKIGDN